MTPVSILRTMSSFEPPSSGSSRQPQRTRRIAIVEDHLLQRTYTAQLIAEQPDMQVVFCGDTLAEFVDYLGEVDPGDRPDLLVLDLVVDRGEDADPHTVSRLTSEGMPVILFSAMASPPLVRRMIHAGISGIIGKRDSTSDIMTALRTALAGGEWITSELAAVLTNDPQRPTLSIQEERALVLYASGLTIDAVATSMGVRQNTVKKYLQRVKQKYASLGREVHTKIDLSREARADGLLDRLEGTSRTTDRSSLRPFGDTTVGPAPT